MKKLCIVLSFAVFILSNLCIAQEKNTQKIELPQKSDEYLVNRGLGNTMSWFFSGIAYAKSKGDTPEDFAKYSINAWKSWWKDMSIPRYFRKIYICFSTDKDFKMEVLKETETSVEVRLNIYGKRWISTFKESGVTEEEYIRFLGAQLTSLTEYIGWDYEIKFEGDWIYLTVSEK
jgi:hypothetical protein